MTNNILFYHNNYILYKKKRCVHNQFRSIGNKYGITDYFSRIIKSYKSRLLWFLNMPVTGTYWLPVPMPFVCWGRKRLQLTIWTYWLFRYIILNISVLYTYTAIATFRTRLCFEMFSIWSRYVRIGWPPPALPFTRGS